MRGFTIVERMIVIAIVGIMTVIAIVGILLALAFGGGERTPNKLVKCSDGTEYVAYSAFTGYDTLEVYTADRQRIIIQGVTCTITDISGE